MLLFFSRAHLGDYLRERLTLPGLGLVFLALAIYRYLQAPYPILLIGYASLTLLIVYLLRPPRGATYLLLTSTFIAIAALMVFSTSAGRQDPLSDRDDAAEAAAMTLLHGKNPWAEKSVLGLPITTSPTGILMSAPFVLLTGHINLLTFFFWIAFIAVLLAGDLWHRNRSFGILLPLLFLPELAVPHTFFWSLEELYFPLIFIAAAAWALARSKYALAGGCTACVLLGRLSYSLPMAGLFFWMILSRDRPLRPTIRFAIGALVTACALLLPFVITSGTSLMRCNFVTIALQTARKASSATSTVSGLATASQSVSPILVGLLLLLVLLVLTRQTARHTRHPFWHVAAGSLMTQLTLFVPASPNDYLLTLMGPALFAVAFTPLPKAPGAPPPI